MKTLKEELKEAFPEVAYIVLAAYLFVYSVYLLSFLLKFR